MNDVLKPLADILAASERLNKQMNEEARVYRRELEERTRLGLTGDAAVQHYNDFMLRFGMGHLVI